MRLSRLYSNRPEEFEPIVFNDGLNVVLAEIRLPENRAKDTHNLGKTTLCRLIDFCLLAGRDPKMFLFKHEDRFREFVFFLEIVLADSSYLTIRRAVAGASKISFKRLASAGQDFSSLPLGDSWDHSDIGFDRAREILDGALGLDALAPWGFRQAMGYLLRSQDDFQDVFQLKKFKGGHGEWKPFVARLMGFDANTIGDLYDAEDQLERRRDASNAVNIELGGTVADLSKIEGMILLKQRDLSKRQELLDAFDFRAQDKEWNRTLVEEIDTSVAQLNSRRYSLSSARKRIQSALNDGSVLFSPEQAEHLFGEVQVSFAGQLKKDFEQLVAFTKAIAAERRGYLVSELVEIEGELKEIVTAVSVAGKRRADVLGFLSETDSFQKYRQMTNEVVALRADIASLERQRVFLHRLQELRAEIRALQERCGELQRLVESDVEMQNSDPHSRFGRIRVAFSEVVEDVIDRKALLSVSPNNEGHLEMRAEILDEAANSTSADEGHSYRKLLCVAFDLAILRTHLDRAFPRFVYHDGVFESLDDRKKSALTAVLREYATLGIQTIITVIDSDLPVVGGVRADFSIEEVVLRLHDEGSDGRLFKMPAW